MKDYKRVVTSAEVWAAIRARHPEMVVFSSFSAPNGDQFGNLDKGRMFTSFGFNGGGYPMVEVQTTWDINSEQPHKRINERHEYWLCVPVKGREIMWKHTNAVPMPLTCQVDGRTW